MPERTKILLPLLLALFLSAPFEIFFAQAARSADVQHPTTSTTNPSGPLLEYTTPPAEYARAKAYSNAKYRHVFVNAFYGFLVLLVLIRWRVAPRFRNFAERISSRHFAQLVIFAPLTLLTLAVLSIAADIWDQSLERAYGLSVAGWGTWLRDWIINQAISVIVITLLVAILYAVMRRSPKRWWFYFWLASIPVMLAVFFAQPLIIDPLFYDFKPLATIQPELLSEMQKVVRRGGMEIPADRMFVMNASSKQTGLNAYVTGFGASKRVVVWDNTIAKATIPETLFVFGHEMGHYVLHHIPKEIALDAAIVLSLLYVAYFLAHWMLRRWGTQWGIRNLEDLASLPVLIFLLTTLAFFATPIFNGISRHFEHEADRYGLEVIHGLCRIRTKLLHIIF